MYVCDKIVVLENQSEFMGGIGMDGRTFGFILWSACGAAFVGLAAYTWFSKKPRPMAFWANAEMFEVSDIKNYNHALSKLFGIFGIVMVLLGFPLLEGQNSPGILLSVVGIMIESIAAMAVYSLVIEKKYRKRS